MVKLVTAGGSGGRSITTDSTCSLHFLWLLCIFSFAMICVQFDRSFLNYNNSNNDAASKRNSNDSTNNNRNACDDNSNTKGQQILSSLYDNAYDDSEGFFDDIDNTVWQRQKNHARGEVIFRNKTDPNYGLDKAIARWMLNNVDPIFTCPHVVRIGGRGDGAKWTCDPHRLATKHDCLVYSIGSAGNYQFEDGLIKRIGINKHCEIHVFDPNPKFQRPDDATKKNIHYHAWGLKSSYAKTASTASKFHTIQEIVEELGHTGRRIDIFKIDCEGCEWTTHMDWVTTDPIIDIRQILIEIHPSIAVRNNISVSDFFQALLHRGYVPFSKEANTHPMATPVGTLFEYGFVRLKSSFLKADS